MEIEIWKDIPGYENYQVSNLGIVKSISRVIKAQLNSTRLKKEKLLKPGITNCGYLYVVLYKDALPKNKTIHQLVAMAFLNHIPNNRKLVVNHVNHNRQNNRLENLEIITQRDNTNLKHISNRSFTGVHKIRNRWRALIMVNGISKHLGYFNTELEASEYYQKALKSIDNNEQIIIKKPTFSSTYKGVSWKKDKNKWIAQIMINKKHKFLGYFKTEIEAHEAYQKELILNNKKNE